MVSEAGHEAETEQDMDKERGRERRWIAESQLTFVPRLASHCRLPAFPTLEHLASCASGR